MAGMLRKAGEYLGLVDVGEYDDAYDEGYYQQPAPAGYGSGPGGYEQQPAPQQPPAYAAAPVSGGHVEAGYPRGRQAPQQAYAPPPLVAPPAEVRITTIAPRAYNDAKQIGEQFRNGIPVIMNLDGMEDADARRLVDFAAGLTFGLHGDLQRVTRGVFLLRPQGVQVALDEAGGSGSVEGGFYNQS